MCPRLLLDMVWNKIRITWLSHSNTFNEKSLLTEQSVSVLEVREFPGRTVVQSDLKGMVEEKCV